MLIKLWWLIIDYGMLYERRHMTYNHQSHARLNVQKL